MFILLRMKSIFFVPGHNQITIILVKHCHGWINFKYSLMELATVTLKKKILTIHEVIGTKPNPPKPMPYDPHALFFPVYTPNKATLQSLQ